jgi:hypothetical protein
MPVLDVTQKHVVEHGDGIDVEDAVSNRQVLEVHPLS